MAAQVKTLSVYEFLAIDDLPEKQDKRLELIDGIKYEMGPSSQQRNLSARHTGAPCITLSLADQRNLGDGGCISKSRAGGTQVAFAMPDDLEHL